MTTADKIAQIEKDQYNNYGGRLMKRLMLLNSHLRFTMGDEKFLEYLKQRAKDNPRPIYQIPEQLTNQ